MKSTTTPFALLLCLFSLMAFTWPAEEKFEHLVAKDIQEGYAHATSSSLLKANLAEVFSDLFDKGEKVDAHYGSQRGHYFTVYGYKDKQAVVKAILVSKEMIKHEFFPNRQQLGMSPDALHIVCYWDNSDGWPNCQYSKTDSVCGRIISGEAVCSDFNIPIPISILILP